MPNLTGQLLKDGHLLNRPTPESKGKRGAKRIPAMSKKRKGESKIYTEKRRAFLEAHPICQAYFAIKAYENPNNPPLTNWPRSEEVHHREHRGKNYLNEATWLAVSKWAHRWIHDNPREARALNLLK